MVPEGGPKPAFSIPGGGHWHFLSMPFGFCNGGATFERLAEKISQIVHGKYVCCI
jgi:hypothetical protein